MGHPYKIFSVDRLIMLGLKTGHGWLIMVTTGSLMMANVNFPADRRDRENNQLGVHDGLGVAGFARGSPLSWMIISTKQSQVSTLEPH